MIVIVLQFAIIVLSIAIYPLQLYRSYNRYQGVDSAQAVVSDWLFPLLIAQSLLWYTYALQSSEWFIIFNSTNNLLCQCCILYCIKHTPDTITASAVQQQNVYTQAKQHVQQQHAYAPVQQHAPTPNPVHGVWDTPPVYQEHNAPRLCHDRCVAPNAHL